MSDERKKYKHRKQSTETGVIGRNGINALRNVALVCALEREAVIGRSKLYCYYFRTIFKLGPQRIQCDFRRPTFIGSRGDVISTHLFWQRAAFFQR